jgi:hypothetical protein
MAMAKAVQTKGGFMSYIERTKINVSKHIEKKGRFNYLSWVYALDELQKQDETAEWKYQEHTIYPDGSMMVTTTVTAFGKTLQMLLPVMDHNNKAIKQPDAFAINKAYMRCLAKNVAAHGIGLYIFAGEDLPHEDDTPTPKTPKNTPQGTPGPQNTTSSEPFSIEVDLKSCKTIDELKKVFSALTKDDQKKYLSIKDDMKIKIVRESMQ